MSTYSLQNFCGSHHGFDVRLAEIVFHFEALSAEHNDGYLERGQLRGLSGTVPILGCMGLRSLSCHRLLTCHYLCLLNTRSECTFGDASETQTCSFKMSSCGSTKTQCRLFFKTRFEVLLLGMTKTKWWWWWHFGRHFQKEILAISCELKLELDSGFCSIIVEPTSEIWGWCIRS